MSHSKSQPKSPIPKIKKYKNIKILIHLLIALCEGNRWQFLWMSKNNHSQDDSPCRQCSQNSPRPALALHRNIMFILKELKKKTKKKTRDFIFSAPTGARKIYIYFCENTVKHWYYTGQQSADKSNFTICPFHYVFEYWI